MYTKIVNMLEVALTGNRYTGKSGIAKLFRQIGTPVFDADVVLKFILNYRTYIDDVVKKNIGNHVYSHGFLDSNKFVTDSDFDKLIDIVEFELFDAYDRFKAKHKDKAYVIFMSSLIFERGYHEKFDMVATVFSSYEERVYRCKIETDQNTAAIHKMFKNEMSDILKNKLSDFVLHNYESAPADILVQVNNMDRDIVDRSIRKNRIVKNHEDIESLIKAANTKISDNQLKTNIYG